MKATDEEALMAGLRALREKAAVDGPPESLEAALLTEFRRRQLRNEPKLRRNPFLWWGLATAAMAVLVAFGVASRPPVQVVQVQPAAVQPAAVQPTTVQRPPESVVIPPPVRQEKRRASRPHRKPALLAQEVATEYLPMPDAPRFTAEDRGQLVRIRLPRESMRSFGLPVNQDRIVQTVKADVLIGEDGIARAIRFVQ